MGNSKKISLTLYLLVSKQWMHTQESNNENDYIYYPIEYTIKVFSTLTTLSYFPNENYCTWVKSIDKSKFIAGIGDDDIGGDVPGSCSVITVGF